MYDLISRNSVRWNLFDWDRVSSFILETGLLNVLEDYRSKNTLKKVASGDAQQQSFCVGQHFSSPATKKPYRAGYLLLLKFLYLDSLYFCLAFSISLGDASKKRAVNLRSCEAACFDCSSITFLFLRSGKLFP